MVLKVRVEFHFAWGKAMNGIYRITTIAGIITVLAGLAPTVYAQTPDTLIASMSAKSGVSKEGMSARDFYNRGVEKHQRGDYRGAIADYTQALQLAPKDADTLFNRGAAYKELRQNSSAIADLQKAAALYQQLGNQEDYQAVQNLLSQIR